jgi:radical SAM protein with 4Fe4S-binding SPASM domain
VSVEGPASQPREANLYEQFVAQSGKAHRLLSAHWELTYRCNEKCTHCYLDVFAPNAVVPGELTTEECLRIMDELAELGVLNLTFSGGEVLTRRDFFQLAEYARAKRFLLRIMTNGILIKPAVADRIAALNPYAVEMSVYSTKPEVHEKITRVPRSLELTLRAMRLLHERGIRTVMKTPLMRENVREIHALRALAQELGAQFRYDTTITPKDSGSLSPLQHRITYEDLVWLFREEFQPGMFQKRELGPEARTCGITQFAIVIDPYGTVFPCIQTRVAAGNVRERSIREIWQGSHVWQDLNLTLSELPVCRTCELRNICTRCHGIALVEDGDVRAPATVNCREALARRQVLIEQGVLPADYPIPAHLQTSVSNLEPYLPPPNFVPVSSLGVPVVTE